MLFRALEFLRSLRWMPVLSAASAFVAVLLALFNFTSPTLPLTFAIVSVALATLSKLD
jgi:hypothetical protein